MSPFTPGELQVMRVLWAHPDLIPDEILAHLPRPLANAALRSVLRVLLHKGHVTRRKVGRAYNYRPKRPARTSFKQMARQLSELFCGGSTANLIAHLIKTEKLSEDDIRALQRMAEARAPGAPRSKKKGKAS